MSSSTEESDSIASVGEESTDAASTSSTTSIPSSNDTGEGTDEQSESEQSSQSSVGPSSTEETSETDCSIPQYSDDIEFELDSEILLMDPQAKSLLAKEKWALICGQSSITGVDTLTAQQIRFELNPDEYCTSLSKIDAKRFLATTQAGRVLLIEQRPNSLELQYSYDLLDPETGDPIPAFGSVTEDDRAWIAAGTAGVIGLSIGTTTLEHHATMEAARDARDLLITPSGELLVADGAFGICLLDPTKLDNSELSRLTSDGISDNVIMQNDQIILLNGAIGFDAITLRDQSLTLQDFTAPIGPSLNAKFDGDQILVAGGSLLSRFEIDSDELIRPVSTELRPRNDDPLAPWIQDIAKIDNRWWALLDSSLVPIRSISNTSAANLEVFYSTFIIEAKPNSDEEPRPVVFDAWNKGSKPLTLTKVEATPPFSARIPKEWIPPRPGCDNQYIIDPGKDLFIYLQLPPENSDPIDGKLSIHSNDPDNPVITVKLLGNPPGPAINSPIEDFNLLTVGRERLRLSDYFGDRFILLKLFDTS